MLLQQGNVGMLAHLFFKGQLHRMAGRVRCVDDAALTVPTFAGEMKAEFRLIVAREGHALRDQPFDRCAALLDDVTGSGFIAQASAGHQRIGHVLIMAVMGVQDRRNTSLRPVTGTVSERTFGNDHHLTGVGQVEGNGQAGQATADNGNIKFHGELAKNAGFRATYATIGDLGLLRTTRGPTQKLPVCSAKSHNFRSGSNSFWIGRLWTASQV